MVEEIYLTQGKVAIVDDIDFEFLNEDIWFAHAADKKWYAQRNSTYVRGVRRTAVHMHRVIAERMGLNIEGKEVDHISGDPLDNRRCNLRVVTRAQNMLNQSRRSDNRSGYKGVGWHKQVRKWRARIDIADKHITIGHFDSAEDAARAYDGKARELHGQFARLNFPEVE